MTEAQAREALVRHGRSLFARGYSCGTSGNLSVRLAGGGYLMSPTNVSLGQLDPEQLSTLDATGAHVDGPAPTKEAWLHLAMYNVRRNDAAVVHLHSTYATALSCLQDRPDDDVLPAITPYVVMRVGRVARVPYARGPATRRCPQRFRPWRSRTAPSFSRITGPSSQEQALTPLSLRPKSWRRRRSCSSCSVTGRTSC